MADQINWREELRKWCEENPPTMPYQRDTSGSVPHELLARVFGEDHGLMLFDEHGLIPRP